LLFVCYVIAYVDRANVAIARLTMTRDLAGLDNAVIGFGAGMLFVGYLSPQFPARSSCRQSRALPRIRTALS
jgi:hypothetical protein